MNDKGSHCRICPSPPSFSLSPPPRPIRRPNLRKCLESLHGNDIPNEVQCVQNLSHLASSPPYHTHNANGAGVVHLTTCPRIPRTRSTPPLHCMPLRYPHLLSFLVTQHSAWPKHTLVSTPLGLDYSLVYPLPQIRRRDLLAPSIASPRRHGLDHQPFHALARFSLPSRH